MRMWHATDCQGRPHADKRCTVLKQRSANSNVRQVHRQPPNKGARTATCDQFTDILHVCMRVRVATMLCHESVKLVFVGVFFAAHEPATTYKKYSKHLGLYWAVFTPHGAAQAL